MKSKRDRLELVKEYCALMEKGCNVGFSRRERRRWKLLQRQYDGGKEEQKRIRKYYEANPPLAIMNSLISDIAEKIRLDRSNRRNQQQ